MSGAGSISPPSISACAGVGRVIGAGMSRMLRSGEKRTQRNVGMTAIAPTKRAVRSERGCPSVPPASVPIGIVPQTIQRIAAFMRPWSRSGVIAWRRLTCVML